MSGLRVLSLFSGIGGIDLGLERAGMQIVAHSEIDPYACRVLAKHWPSVPNLGDITTLDAAPWAGSIDVIAGGFPCQDISYAGKGAGIIEGETRSGLWTEYARLVRELRPRYVIVENVAALLARGMERVLGDLAALGYDAWWDCIPAASVGAPHRRDRVFIVATRSDAAPFQPSIDPMRWAAGLAAHAEERREAAADALHQGPSRRSVSSGAGQEHANAGAAGWWRAEPRVGRVAHGVSGRVGQLRAYGNAVVPQVAEYIGRMVVAEHEKR